MKKQNKTDKKISQRNLIFLLTVAVIFIIVASTLITLILASIFIKFEYLKVGYNISLVAIALLSCVIVGAGLSYVFTNYFIKPVFELSDATSKISQGDFNIELDVPKNFISKYMEISTLTENFNHMAKELHGIEMFRNDFTSNFSHEFKTPIISIRGFAKQLCANDLEEEKRKEYAKIIVDESDRLVSMSANVLLITKYENQNIVTNKTTYRLDDQLRKCMLLFEESWNKKNININMDLEEITYSQNRELIGHIWKNIIGNSVKFTPENGKITVSCKKNEEKIFVTVEDTGIGMDEETQLHIFEKFYKGDLSHHGSGNGLGLPIVNRITKMAGGTVNVNSEVGKGTKIEVILPI